MWTLFSVRRSPEQRRQHYMQVVGRLKPGATLEQARADMAGVADRIAVVAPDTNKGWGVTIEPLRDAIVGQELRTTSLVLAGVVTFVLLMACANVANLLLARGLGRAARDRGARGARRQPAAHRPATADREPAARGDRRRRRPRARLGLRDGRAVADPARHAAAGDRARLRRAGRGRRGAVDRRNRAALRTGAGVAGRRGAARRDDERRRPRIDQERRRPACGARRRRGRSRRAAARRRGAADPHADRAEQRRSRLQGGPRADDAGRPAAEPVWQQRKAGCVLPGGRARTSRRFPA